MYCKRNQSYDFEIFSDYKDRERGELSSTSLQNVRLQFDTVVPSLCDVISSLDDLKTLTDENVDTISAVFDTLISVARTENW